MQILRLQALPGSLYASVMGWSTHSSSRVQELRQANDDVVEYDRPLSGRTDRKGHDMSWVTFFAKAWKVIKEAIKYAPVVIELFRDLPPRIRRWWNRKKIAVIGPTAVGKNSLYHRLKDEPIPDDHNQTKGAERIPNFNYRRTLPNGKQFEVTFKRCINVGGEMAERNRYWFDACDDADVIFYMITLDDLKNQKFRQGSRIHSDLKWLATHMGKMRPNVLVHLLVNKIDKELEGGEEYTEFVAKLKPPLDELESTANALFGDYKAKLTGISPTSMKDDHIFAVSFPKALEAVYEAVHPR